MAARLRPEDLWLPHDEHSCPETAAWDWDMRPLARGERAVPIQVSGREGVRPATGIAIAEVLAECPGFTDQGIVCEMVDGDGSRMTAGAGEARCCAHRTPGLSSSWMW